MAELTHTTGPIEYIIGEDFSPAGKLPEPQADLRSVTR
jgi:hypothetical protein